MPLRSPAALAYSNPCSACRAFPFLPIFEISGGTFGSQKVYAECSMSWVEYASKISRQLGCCHSAGFVICWQSFMLCPLWCFYLQENSWLTDARSLLKCERIRSGSTWDECLGVLSEVSQQLSQYRSPTLLVTITRVFATSNTITWKKSYSVMIPREDTSDELVSSYRTNKPSGRSISDDSYVSPRRKCSSLQDWLSGPPSPAAVSTSASASKKRSPPTRTSATPPPKPAWKPSPPSFPPPTSVLSYCPFWDAASNEFYQWRGFSIV